MKYKALFFDFDYTLADASDGIIVGIESACRAMGMPYLGDEKVRLGMGGTLQQICDLAVGAPLEGEAFDAFREVYVQASEAVLLEKTWFFEDVPASLAAFCDMGLKLCIVTNKKTHITNEPLERDGLDKFFTYVMGRDRMPAPKPDGRGVQALCAQLGLQESEVIFVGDSIYDAETAKNAGTHFCPVLTGKTTRAQFEPFAPLFMAEHMADLVAFLRENLEV